MKTLLVLLTVLTFTPHLYATSVNKLNVNGKRIGHWMLDSQNKPTSRKSEMISEGKFLNGRKEGVWIFYYQGGKKPRLIGEYSDNRPSGSYFRFDKNGRLEQASAVARKLRETNRVFSKNHIFNCQLNFENREIVAGQVFFSKEILPNNAMKFWVEKNLECEANKATVADFTWLNTNYAALYSSYVEARKPSKRSALDRMVNTDNPEAAVKLSPEQVVAKQGNYYLAPYITRPRTAKGISFQPFGVNKLYTKNSEIWIDGLFKEGQLQDGKIFIYDRDGVLLKVRVYKNGVYISDGVL